MKKTKKDSYSSIMAHIKENGGFDNFRKWDTHKKAIWVLCNFNCTKYMAKKVARNI